MSKGTIPAASDHYEDDSVDPEVVHLQTLCDPWRYDTEERLLLSKRKAASRYPDGLPDGTLSTSADMVLL